MQDHEPSRRDIVTAEKGLSSSLDPMTALRLDETSDNNGKSERCISWNPKALRNFFRPCKDRMQSQHSSEHLIRAFQKSLDLTSTDEEEEVTEPETDSGSDDSPLYKTNLDSGDVFLQQSSNQPALELYTGSSSYIDLQSSDLTYPSDDDDIDDEDSEAEAFFSHRDDICLLKDDWYSSIEQATFRPQSENFIAQLQVKEEEVSLLSERDDIDNRHICYNIDTIDSDSIALTDEFTFLELQWRAHEGEISFKLNEAPFIPSFRKRHKKTRSRLPTTVDRPLWSEELRRRLEIQKAYQQRLSYGGRNTKRSKKSSPHGELWTVSEGISEDEEID